MNIKFRRLARTPYSEKQGLYDLDERDDQGEPVNFGLLHLHYLAAEVRGTLLLAPAYWQRALTNRRHGGLSDPLGSVAPQQRRDAEADAAVSDDETALIEFADMIMREACAPIGVPAACRVAIAFVPPAQRRFYTNSDRLRMVEEIETTEEEPEVRPRGLFSG